MRKSYIYKGRLRGASSERFYAGMEKNLRTSTRPPEEKKVSADLSHSQQDQTPTTSPQQRALFF